MFDNSALYQPLMANLGLAAAIVTIWSQLIEHRATAAPRFHAVLLGLLLGGGAVLAMLMPFTLAPGLFVDMRAVMVALAGLFGGPIGGLVAAALAGLWRWSAGGLGMVPGVVAILAAAALGIHARWRVGAAPPGPARLVELGAGVAASSIAACFLLPEALWATVLPKLLVPMSLMLLVGITLVGLALTQAQRRHEMARSNALYRAMVEALPDCLNVKDRDGRFMLANAATARLMGASCAAGLVGKGDADFYPVELVHTYREDERRFFESDGRPLELEQPTAEGGWIASLKSPLRDAQGRLVGIITHNRDITLRKRTELRLAAAEAHLRDAIANMGTGLELFDAEDRLVIASGELKAMFPRSADLRRPGIGGAALIRGVAARGEYAGLDACTVEAWVAAHRAQDQEDRRTDIDLVDGRIIEAFSRRTSAGGRIVLYRDVTEQRLSARELEHKADHDPLTGLANRARFDRELAAAQAEAAEGGRGFALMLLDLDRFKQVNDSHGHAAGDRLLVAVGERLRAHVRSGDLVARLGGDEFAVLARQRRGRDFGTMAQRLLAVLAEPVEWEGTVLLPAASFGLTIAPDDPGTPAELMAHADRALYAAKAGGRGRSQMHPPMPDGVAERRAA